jgi:hypothetical protein
MIVEITIISISPARDGFLFLLDLRLGATGCNWTASWFKEKGENIEK